MTIDINPYKMPLIPMLKYLSKKAREAGADWDAENHSSKIPGVQDAIIRLKMLKRKYGETLDALSNEETDVEASQFRARIKAIEEAIQELGE